MRPIKFRGRDKRENVFYGSYNQDMGCIDDWEYAACHAVDPDAVAQLVGYDTNGNELYEGDTVVDKDGYEFHIPFLEPAFFNGFKLKEETAQRLSV